MKTPLPITYLLLLTFLKSCKKEDLPHPLIGSWTHYSESFQAGIEFEKLIFEEDMEGEHIYESSPLCIYLESITTNDSTPICYGGQYSDSSIDFEWHTKEDYIYMKSYSPSESFESEWAYVEQSTNTISGTLLINPDDLQRNDSIFNNQKWRYKIDGDKLILFFDREEDINLYYSGFQTHKDTLIYNRE